MKRFAIIAAALACLLAASWAQAAEMTMAQESLKGLGRVTVLVRVNPPLEQAKITPIQMRQEVEKKLGQAGLELAGMPIGELDQQEADRGYLRLDLIGHQAPDKTWVWQALLSLDQYVALSREPGQVLIGSTWQMSTGGVSRPEDLAKMLTKYCLGMADRFTNDYRLANPKP